MMPNPLDPVHPDGPLQAEEVVDLPSRPVDAGPAPRATETIERRPRARYGDGAVIVCDGLVRIYKLADLEVVALQGLDLLVEAGEMVAIVGASGSGKSTLLAILGGMDVPSAGRAVVAGYDLGRMSSAERTRFRRRVVGFVWQQTGRNLLPYLSAVENVELPMILDGRAGRRARALELLDLVGLADRADASAGPALGRRAAAGGDRGRPRQRPVGRACRRAHGRARQPDVGRRVRAAPAGSTRRSGRPSSS